MPGRIQWNSFICQSCGSPGIDVPDEIHGAAVLSCGGCKAPICTWAEFRERARQIIIQEIQTNRLPLERASSDFGTSCLVP